MFLNINFRKDILCYEIKSVLSLKFRITILTFFSLGALVAPVANTILRRLVQS